MSRPSWDVYFLRIAGLVATRSTCTRRHVGAVLVRDRILLATGYNGAPKGLKDCLELRCLRDQQGIASGTRHEVCRATHAETNAIAQAASQGVSVNGSTLYCNLQPCGLCARMIINAGIKRIVIGETYTNRDSETLFQEAGISVETLRLEEEELP